MNPFGEPFPISLDLNEVPEQSLLVLVDSTALGQVTRDFPHQVQLAVWSAQGVQGLAGF